MSASQVKDAPMASLEVVRTLINHWVRFIQKEDPESTLRVDGLPGTTTVLEEKAILELMKIPQFRGMSSLDIAGQVSQSLIELKAFSFKMAMDEKRQNETGGGSVSHNDSSTSLEVVESCFKKVKALLSKRYTNSSQPSQNSDHLLIIS